MSRRNMRTLWLFLAHSLARGALIDDASAPAQSLTRIPINSVMLYSSTDAPDVTSTADSNSYLPFKTVDSTVVIKIMSELDDLDAEDERAPSAIVSALTKALSCEKLLASSCTDTIDHNC